MIASVRGTVSYKSPELRKDAYAIIDVGGVGYKVFTTLQTHRRLEEGSPTTLFTHMAVSERALDLYGFSEPADKTFFLLLLDVPSIGPKSALGIMEKTTMKDVQQAILDNNPTLLTSVAGLSDKTVDKIIVSLKDKVEKLSARPRGTKSIDALGDADAFEALINFGYTGIEAKKALSKVDPSITDSGQRVKAALKLLATK